MKEPVRKCQKKKCGETHIWGGKVGRLTAKKILCAMERRKGINHGVREICGVLKISLRSGDEMKHWMCEVKKILLIL